MHAGAGKRRKQRNSKIYLEMRRNGSYHTSLAGKNKQRSMLVLETPLTEAPMVWGPQPAMQWVLTSVGVQHSLLWEVPHLHTADERQQSGPGTTSRGGEEGRAGSTHLKSLPPLTARVLPARTSTASTMSSCSYLQNLLTMRVSFSSSSHSSTAPAGHSGGPASPRAPGRGEGEAGAARGSPAGAGRGRRPALTGVGAHQDASVRHPAQVGHARLGLDAGGAEALAGGAPGVGEHPDGAGPAAAAQPRGAQQQRSVCGRDRSAPAAPSGAPPLPPRSPPPRTRGPLPAR